MTPQEFVTKWRESSLKESAASQEHFIDLCRMLGERTPADADPSGNWYAFEKGATKTGGGDGWADVWKRGCFAWEYKGKGKDLGQALRQLKLYAGALENPPLLIVSDMEKIEIHTNWTNMVQERHVFGFDDLLDARKRAPLKKAFSETAVEELKPGRKRADLTAEVASEFVKLAQSLRARGHQAEKVAHFVNRMVFCMFAEDVELLPNKLFKKLLEVSRDDPGRFVEHASRLFATMKDGGSFDLSKIEWFNGGLFDDDTALPLTRDDINTALNAANQDWSNIDPSIMGTLFERGLDPDKRSQLGAHYTDPDKIMMIVNPVVIEPLAREWESVKAEIAAELEKREKARTPGAKTQAFNRAKSLKVEFLERLKRFRILDPACGSGNFLYLGLKALKDIEHRVNMDSESLGIPRDFPAVGPENMLGIEINPFAAELARVSVWIGEIQWMREHGFDASRNPILKSLDNIACHDALLNDDGTEYEWPAAEAIIGNPPFLGRGMLRDNLGNATVETLFEAYDGIVSAESDLVCYWLNKAWRQVSEERTVRAGLVATNSIRGGANRQVLDEVCAEGEIFEAWSDEPWILEGAAVRVSIICFSAAIGQPKQLDGAIVPHIHADLTAQTVDLTRAISIDQNRGVCLQGSKKIGAFDISGTEARRFLAMPLNPHNRPNADVVFPYLNGLDVARRSRDMWIIDFGLETAIGDAALYEAPFAYVERHVKSVRESNRRESRRDRWWRHGDPQPKMRRAIAPLNRFIVKPAVQKHFFFVFCCKPVLPDCQLLVIAREDDTTFGLLHSHMHELWALALGTWLGVGNDPRYTPSTTFETFPFPEGLTPNIPADQYASDPRAVAIATAAKRLNELRENWLNPPDLVKRVSEVVPGYPDRILPKDDAAAAILKKRTLTNLYNERPTWLDHAHRDLDKAVAAAYGWTDWGNDGLADDVILERLFKLNQERAAKQSGK